MAYGQLVRELWGNDGCVIYIPHRGFLQFQDTGNRRQRDLILSNKVIRRRSMLVSAHKYPTAGTGWFRCRAPVFWRQVPNNPQIPTQIGGFPDRPKPRELSVQAGSMRIAPIPLDETTR